VKHAPRIAGRRNAAVADNRNGRALFRFGQKVEMHGAAVALRRKASVQRKGVGACLFGGVEDIEDRDTIRVRSKARLEGQRQTGCPAHRGENGMDAAGVMNQSGAGAVRGDFADRAAGVEVNAGETSGLLNTGGGFCQ